MTENKGDLISREALKKTFALLMWKEHNPFDVIKVCDIVNQTLDFIDNAPTVKFSLLPADESKDEAYMRGYKIGKAEGILKANTRLQSNLADEVWKLYKKHQSHLATYVIEFGNELKDLLGKYKKGGAE